MSTTAFRCLPTQAPRFSSFVINLHDRTDRLAAFRSRADAAGLWDHMERVEAVDTRRLAQLTTHQDTIECRAYHKLIQETTVNGNRETHSDLTPGAVGCALSHMAVARQALERNLSVIAVFEDDAVLRPDTVDMIHGLLDQSGPHASSPSWDCLLLGWSGAPPAPSNHNHPPCIQVQPVDKFWGMHAYLLTQSGMSKLLQWNTPIATQIDHTLSHARDFVVYGVSQQEDRMAQGCRGSDIHIPLRR